MSYKERLKLKGYNHIINNEVDIYFLNLGFEKDDMSPAFFDERSHYDEIESLNSPALVLIDSNEDYCSRYYISSKEIYKEKETSWGSFISSNIHKFDKEPQDITIQEIEEILEEIVD